MWPSIEYCKLSLYTVLRLQPQGHDGISRAVGSSAQEAGGCTDACSYL